MSGTPARSRCGPRDAPPSSTRYVLPPLGRRLRQKETAPSVGHGSGARRRPGRSAPSPRGVPDGRRYSFCRSLSPRSGRKKRRLQQRPDLGAVHVPGTPSPVWRVAPVTALTHTRRAVGAILRLSHDAGSRLSPRPVHRHGRTRPWRHGGRLHGPRSSTGALGRNQGLAARPDPRRHGQAAIFCRKRKPPRPSTTLTSAPSTRSTRPLTGSSTS